MTNWYKKAIVFEHRGLLDSGKSYLDIGHARAVAGNYLWAWANNRLEVTPAYGDEGEKLHSTWEVAKDIKTPFSGRFDANSKELSIVTHKSMSNLRGIPDTVLSALYRQFGEDIEIHWYRSWD